MQAGQAHADEAVDGDELFLMRAITRRQQQRDAFAVAVELEDFGKERALADGITGFRQREAAGGNTSHGR